MQTNEIEIESENEKIYSFEHVLQLTTWARVISWVFFVVGAVMFIMVVFTLISGLVNAGMPEIFDLLYMFILLAVSLLPIFLGLVLQFFAEGAYLLVDIEQNTSNKAS